MELSQHKEFGITLKKTELRLSDLHDYLSKLLGNTVAEKRYGLNKAVQLIAFLRKNQCESVIFAEHPELPVHDRMHVYDPEKVIYQRPRREGKDFPQRILARSEKLEILFNAADDIVTELAIFERELRRIGGILNNEYPEKFGDAEKVMFEGAINVCREAKEYLLSL